MNIKGWSSREVLIRGLILLVYVVNVFIFVFLFSTRFSIVFAFLGLGFLFVKVLFDDRFSSQNQLRLTLFIFEFGVFYAIILLQRLLDLWTM